MKPEPPDAESLFAAHSRSYSAYQYVYPVLSRRSRGISIGVNLNRDKACTFRCVYCQVDRTTPGVDDPIDFDRLAAELDHAIGLVQSGELFEGPQFGRTPPELRRLNDIALSGDGEPTMCPEFEKAVAVCADARKRHALDDVKLVLITNSSLLDRESVARGLELLDANNGEIWAKLDAGTEAYYQQVDRSAVPFARILENLRETARKRPIVIQTLWMRLLDRGPSRDELEAYCRRLVELIEAGGRIKLVQIHTVARVPAESWVGPLSTGELNAIAELVRGRTGLPVAVFGA